MVVGVWTTRAISSYLSCELESCSWGGLLYTTLCDKVCQWLATGLWFSPVLRFPPPIKTYHHDIAEILLKVAFNTITLTLVPNGKMFKKKYFLPTIHKLDWSQTVYIKQIIYNKERIHKLRWASCPVISLSGLESR